MQSSLDPGKTDVLKELILFLVELNSVFSIQTMAASNLPDGVGFLDHVDFPLITASRVSENAKNGRLKHNTTSTVCSINHKNITESLGHKSIYHSLLIDTDKNCKLHTH